MSSLSYHSIYRGGYLLTLLNEDQKNVLKRRISYRLLRLQISHHFNHIVLIFQIADEVLLIIIDKIPHIIKGSAELYSPLPSIAAQTKFWRSLQKGIITTLPNIKLLLLPSEPKQLLFSYIQKSYGLFILSESCLGYVFRFDEGTKCWDYLYKLELPSASIFSPPDLCFHPYLNRIAWQKSITRYDEDNVDTTLKSNFHWINVSTLSIHSTKFQTTVCTSEYNYQGQHQQQQSPLQVFGAIPTRIALPNQMIRQMLFDESGTLWIIGVIDKNNLCISVYQPSSGQSFTSTSLTDSNWSDLYACVCDGSLFIHNNRRVFLFRLIGCTVQLIASYTLPCSSLSIDSPMITDMTPLDAYSIVLTDSNRYIHILSTSIRWQTASVSAQLYVGILSDFNILRSLEPTLAIELALQQHSESSENSSTSNNHNIEDNGSSEFENDDVGSALNKKFRCIAKIQVPLKHKISTQEGSNNAHILKLWHVKEHDAHTKECYIGVYDSECIWTIALIPRLSSRARNNFVTVSTTTTSSSKHTDLSNISSSTEFLHQLYKSTTIPQSIAQLLGLNSISVASSQQSSESIDTRNEEVTPFTFDRIVCLRLLELSKLANSSVESHQEMLTETDCFSDSLGYENDDISSDNVTHINPFLLAQVITSLLCNNDIQLQQKQQYVNFYVDKEVLQQLLSSKSNRISACSSVYQELLESSQESSSSWNDVFEESSINIISTSANHSVATEMASGNISHRVVPSNSSILGNSHLSLEDVWQQLVFERFILRQFSLHPGDLIASIRAIECAIRPLLVQLLSERIALHKVWREDRLQNPTWSTVERATAPPIFFIDDLIEASLEHNRDLILTNSKTDMQSDVTLDMIEESMYKIAIESLYSRALQLLLCVVNPTARTFTDHLSCDPKTSSLTSTQESVLIQLSKCCRNDVLTNNLHSIFSDSTSNSIKSSSPILALAVTRVYTVFNTTDSKFDFLSSDSILLERFIPLPI